MSRKKFQEIAVGILIVGGIVVFIFLAFKVGGINFGKSNIYIIPTRDALGLVENSSVMIAGVEVGRVKQLAVKNSYALITISIDSNIILREGTKFYIRGKSLLGEKYLDIRPGPESSKPLPQNVVLSNWATHETEIGDFVSKIDKDYMPSPKQFKELVASMLFLFASKKDEIAELIDWSSELANNIPPEKVGSFLLEVKRDLKLLELIEADYIRWRGKINNLINWGEQLSLDYYAIRRRFQQYGEYAPSPTDVANMMERMNRLLDSTSRLVCNLNFQLHKLDNVDFETIMEILEDRGFKVRFWGRSKKEKDRDLKLYRSYPNMITGRGCK